MRKYATAITVQAVAGALKRAGFEQIAAGRYHGSGFRVQYQGNSVTVSHWGQHRSVTTDWERLARLSDDWCLARYAEALAKEGYIIRLILLPCWGGGQRLDPYLSVHPEMPALSKDAIPITPEELKARAVETAKATERARLWDEGEGIEAELRAKVAQFDALKAAYEAVTGEGAKPWPAVTLLIDRDRADG
jgi:hypothetical protein